MIPYWGEKKSKKFFFSTAAVCCCIHTSHSCILPELACDVTKSKITAKVIWASLNLRLTFHLIWVSMTAAEVHGKWLHFFSTIMDVLKFLGNTKSREKVPEKERKRGRGECVVDSQAAIRGLLV